MNMTDEERGSTNRFLHEKVMGECWHDLETVLPHCTGRCRKCPYKQGNNVSPNPRYCSSLDLVSKVEKKVIEKVGIEEYVRNLFDGSALTNTRAMGVCATASAEQRAQACKTAWEAQA